MRWLPPLVALLVLAGPAGAATIRGTVHGDALAGTPLPDRIVAGKGNDHVQAAFGGADEIDCGPGLDVVSADLGDMVAPSCEIVSRRLSVDTSTNADGQHETAVEPDGFAWGSTVVAAFQLGRRESGGATNIGTALSRDAGRTWQRSVLPAVTVDSSPTGPETAASDPTVVYDVAHGVWLVATLTIEPGGSHVYVARSTDGVHWSAPVDAASGAILDKEWLVCDNGVASPFRGRCYAEYTDDQKNVTVSQSSDDGGLTWSQPVTAADFLVGTQPVVQPNGTLVVVVGDYQGRESATGSIVSLRSTDGGATFARFTVSNLESAPNGAMRAIALPSIDVGSDGTIYAAWDDCRFRPGCAANDIVVSTSPDGVSWSAPTRVPLFPASSTSSAFIPGLGADPAQPGHLGLVYANYVPGSCQRAACLLGIGFTQSRDGGRTWIAPQQLDAKPMQMSWLARTEGGRMVGDYFSTSFAGGRVIPVFALAAPPLRDRFREAIFAASLRALR